MRITPDTYFILNVIEGVLIIPNRMFGISITNNILTVPFMHKCDSSEELILYLKEYHVSYEIEINYDRLYIYIEPQHLPDEIKRLLKE